MARVYIRKHYAKSHPSLSQAREFYHDELVNQDHLLLAILLKNLEGKVSGDSIWLYCLNSVSFKVLTLKIFAS